MKMLNARSEERRAKRHDQSWEANTRIIHRQSNQQKKKNVCFDMIGNGEANKTSAQKSNKYMKQLK